MSTDGGSGNQHESRVKRLQKMKLKEKHKNNTTAAPRAKSHGGKAGVEHRRAPLPASNNDETENPLTRKKFRRLQTSANGREYFENLDKPGETTWEVPAGGAIVQTKIPKSSKVNRMQNKKRKIIMRKKTTSQKVTNPLTSVNRMFRRLETSIGGREYFENVNKPGQTAWEVPENAAILNGKPIIDKTSSTTNKEKVSSFNYSTTQEASDPNHHRKGTSSRTLIEMSILTDELLLQPVVENGKNEEQELSMSTSSTHNTSKFYKRPTCSVINAFRLLCGALCCCLFFLYLLSYITLFFDIFFY